jgi:hypothetical protein
MSLMREVRTTSNARTGRKGQPRRSCHRAQRIAREPWHDLAPKPRIIARITNVLACPFVIAAMVLGIRYAALVICFATVARICTGRGSSCESFARAITTYQRVQCEYEECSHRNAVSIAAENRAAQRQKKSNADRDLSCNGSSLLEPTFNETLRSRHCSRLSFAVSKGLPPCT